MLLKAALQDSSSILMAEAATLALVTTLLNHMDIHSAHLVSDNQLLVNYINGPYSPNPPDWRIKPYAEIVSSTLPSSCRIYQIRRMQNHMADSLARQSLHLISSNQQPFSGLCTNTSHVHGYPLLSALQFVTINSIMD